MLIHAAVNIAAADNHCNLHANIGHLFDLTGILVQHLRVYPIVAIPHQRFAGEF